MTCVLSTAIQFVAEVFLNIVCSLIGYINHSGRQVNSGNTSGRTCINYARLVYLLRTRRVRLYNSGEPCGDFRTRFKPHLDTGTKSHWSLLSGGSKRFTRGTNV